MKDISRPGGSGTTSKFKPRFKFTLLNDHFDHEKLELNEIAQDRTGGNKIAISRNSNINEVFIAELSIPFPVQPLLMVTLIILLLTLKLYFLSFVSRLKLKR